MEDEKIIQLIEGFGAGRLSEEEEIAFFQWYSQAGLKEFQRVYAQCRLPKESLPGSPEMPEAFRAHLEQAIREHEEQAYVRTVPLFRRWRLGWVAAMVIIAGTGAYLFHHRRQTPAPEIVQLDQPASGDVAPGTTRAVLTLADGSRITLDSARSGQLAVQGRTTVQKEHGAITYNNAAQKFTPDQLYNTLTTNRGEQSPPLTLSDGTKVWLNALSSIRFPVAFTGNAREVEITGEAYFEVAKDPARPFHVKTREMDVQVLGTQFNINAYPGEPDIRTTLLEGSVRIASGGKGLTLEPGQQAGVQGGISLVKAPDIDQAMAWKRGLFDFNHANLQTVLRQLARWYDIEVKFEGNVPVRSFHGKITRDLNLSQVIQVLQDVDVKFRIEGKTLIVTQ